MRRNRKGSMLIQQVILMSSAGVLFMSGTTILHRGFNFSREHRKQHFESLSSRRLALQFRQDVQFAQSIVDTSSDRLSLQALGQRIVRYEILNDSIQRQVLLSDNATIVATEQFAIPTNAQATIDSENRRCKLTVEFKAPQSKPAGTLAHLVVSGSLLPERKTESKADRQQEDQTSE